MRKTVSFILLISLFCSLLGCSFGESSLKEPIVFYYQRAEFQYGTADAVVTPEKRDVSGHDNDYNYLLSLYLMGPLDESLCSPFPVGTKLSAFSQKDNKITVTLSAEQDNFSEAGFSLAAACFGLTCISMTGADEITVTFGDRSTVITAENLVLFDTGYENSSSENGG